MRCICFDVEAGDPAHFYPELQWNYFASPAKAAHGEVAEFLDNFRRLRTALNEICAISTELLRRHEDLG